MPHNDFLVNVDDYADTNINMTTVCESFNKIYSCEKKLKIAATHETVFIDLLKLNWGSLMNVIPERS
jgi:hypothetical protein